MPRVYRPVVAIVSVSLYAPDACGDCERVGLEGWECFDSRHQTDTLDFFIEVGHNGFGPRGSTMFCVGLNGHVLSSVGPAGIAVC